MYSSTRFGRPHAHHQELNYSSNFWFLLLERGGSSAPTVKQEAATAVVELLMMGVGMPETC
jgi:hypothetical protein